MIEVKNPTGIRLTRGDDGIFLHFDGGQKKAGILLDCILTHGPVTNNAISEWAEKQLSMKDEARSSSEVTSTTHTTICCKYTEDCCGCLDIIYSSLRQQIEVRCNECGKTSVIMNSEGYLVS